MVTVTHTFELPDGTPDQGRVSFRIAAPAVDDTPQTHTVTSMSVAAELDETGSFSVDLTASDDPGWRLDSETMTAGGMPYIVSIRCTTWHDTFTAYIPEGDGTQDLADLIVLDYPPHVAAVPGPQGPPGVSTTAAYHYRMSANSDADIDPGSGQLAVESTGGQNRRLALSALDANSITRNVGVLLPGAQLTAVYNADGVPPADSIVQYVVTQVVDQGTWVKLETVRTVLYGAPSVPPAGASIQLVMTLGVGDYYLTQAAGDARYVLANP